MKRIIMVVLMLLGVLVISAPSAQAEAVCQTPFANPYPAGVTKISSTPIKWSQTDGNVITSEIITGTTGGPYLAIGGNFTKIFEPTGATVLAKNFAILRISDGKVIKSFTVDGYPRTMKNKNGSLYVGGSLTAVNGIPRKAVFAINSTSYAVLPWNPIVSGGTIRKLTVANNNTVYMGGNGSVMAFNAAAAKLWEAPASGGVVRTLLLTPTQTGLYVGGDFSKLGGVVINQLAQVATSTGKINAAFAPVLRPSTTTTSHDGELVLELAANTKLFMGFGGSSTNGVKALDPVTGKLLWSHNTEGDTQGLGLLGNTILTGSHRSHGNTTTGCPYFYFGNQWTQDNGTVLPWNPGLNNGTLGKSTTASVQSEANGGISDILVDIPTRKVFVTGDFTNIGGVCDYASTTLFSVKCTGGTPLRGLAVYWF